MFNSSTQENLYNQLMQIIADNENRSIITAALKEASKDDLLKVLTANIPKKFLSDQEYTLTLLGLAIYADNQEDIKAILNAAKEQNILEDVLSTANIITKLQDSQECTLTPLGFAIYFNNQEKTKAILDAAKEQNVLKDVLTITNIIRKLQNGQEHTLTPLGFTICFNNQEKTKAILDAAKEQNILKDVLTTANIIRKLQDGQEHTLTPLGFATYFNSQENIKAILDVAKEQNILKEVFAATKEDDREHIKTILREAGEHDILTKILQVETSISTNKAMKIGVTLCVITALTIGIGCFAANVELSMLVIAGIAVAAALAVGIVAGGITYAVLKPSDKLDKACLQGLSAAQQLSLNREVC